VATRKKLTTTEIAREIGVHPNTVRLYEEWGYLQPVPRNPKNNYREFSTEHLDQMRLAWSALHADYWHSAKRILVQMVHEAAAGNLGQALESAYRYASAVRAETGQAELAVTYLERWALGRPAESTGRTMQIGEAAEFLGVSRDVLRNWERNHLLQVPRDPKSGYRLYGAEEIGRLRVIRMLRQAGYSMMAILRMITAFDRGETENLREVLDTPGENEFLFSAADSWLSTLKACGERAALVISMLEEMIARRSGPAT
jgi:DNA-binding transcriptional MerR regulator